MGDSCGNTISYSELHVRHSDIPRRSRLQGDSGFCYWWSNATTSYFGDYNPVQHQETRLGKGRCTVVREDQNEPMTDIDAAVSSLLQARRLDIAMQSPSLPDAHAAYAVQAGVAKALGWFGKSVPLHWKSGGASRSAPQTHAPLPPAGVWSSPAVAGAWPFHLRGIEAEVALRLGVAVDAGLAATLDETAARECIDAMCVAIEVVDSRWSEGLSAPPLAKLADLQSHGALVLGPWARFSPRDWSAQSGQVRIGTQSLHEFRGSHSMGDPSFVLLAWLRHGTRNGEVLAAGSVVTTGSW